MKTLVKLFLILSVVTPVFGVSGNENSAQITLKPGEVRIIAGIRVTCSGGSLDQSIFTDLNGYSWKLLPGKQLAYDWAVLECNKLNSEKEKGWTAPSRLLVEQSSVSDEPRFQVDFWTVDKVVMKHFEAWYAIEGGSNGFSELPRKEPLPVVCVR